MDVDKETERLVERQKEVAQFVDSRHGRESGFAYSLMKACIAAIPGLLILADHAIRSNYWYVAAALVTSSWLGLQLGKSHEKDREDSRHKEIQSFMRMMEERNQERSP